MTFRTASPIRRLAPLWALALGLGSLLWAPGASAACRLEGFAAIGVTMIGMRPTVHATLNGQDAVFLVDTGAFASVLSPAAADRYHVRVYRRSSIGVEGIGGATFAQAARVEYVQLGGASFYDMPFLVVDGVGRDVAGVLGQDILGQADAEYDFANGVMRLIRPKGCNGSDVLSYWTDRPSVLQALPSFPRSGAAGAFGQLNGQKVRVGLDSGSAYSGMTLKAAARAGVTPQTPDVAPTRPTSGIAGRPAPTWSGPFDSFALGPEAVIHTRLRISRADLGEYDMLLGADFFLAHRIYVSRLQRRIYFTYNGGPVFRLHEPPPVSWTFKGSADSAAAGGDPNAPVGASGFARRGSASVARNDIPAAVDDFTRAIALEPQTAAFYFDRGAAYAIEGRSDEALADFDAGLKLHPDNASALLARASVEIGAGRGEPARADLAAAVKGGADDATVGLKAAVLYERAGLYPEALAAYDAWLARNAGDELAPDALAGRCRTRALARIGLDLAVKDCEAALRRRRDDAELLASRSLVHLARGELDSAIADADAALKTGDRPFWALEGRGLAELDKGLAADGQADLQAAAKVDSRLAESARKLGLGPPFDPVADAGR